MCFSVPDYWPLDLIILEIHSWSLFLVSNKTQSPVNLTCLKVLQEKQVLEK
jgi:hypothetical protein